MESLVSYVANFKKKYKVKGKKKVPVGDNKLVYVEEKLVHDPELFKNIVRDPPKTKKQKALEEVAERQEFALTVK